MTLRDCRRGRAGSTMIHRISLGPSSLHPRPSCELCHRHSGGAAPVGPDCRLRAPGVRRTQMRTSLLSVLWIGLLATSSPAAAQHYAQTNLVSDEAGEARFTDSHLVNAWGLVSSATS